MNKVDLTFPNMPLGTHQTPWNLQILLRCGAASIPRKQAVKAIGIEPDKNIDKARFLIVTAIHEAISAMISHGLSRAMVESSLEVLWRFFAWSDEHKRPITHDDVIETFKSWSEYQIYRSTIKKEISENYAYRQVSKLANLMAKALELPGSKPGKNLLMKTRVRKPRAKKKVLSTKADKQNLHHTFEFGHCLSAICDTLSLEIVRGRLPIHVVLPNNKELIVAGSLLNPLMDVETIKDNTVRKNAEKARAAMADDESLFDRHKRSGILNLRIEAELLIFIAQTGMNLMQAASLQRESYRWKSNGDDLEVFRVYKGRRGGEAIFRCFKYYRKHLERYLRWLDEAGFTEFDNRLFPLQSRSIIRAKGSKIRFYTAKPAFDSIGIPFIGPQALRKTRVNWLLRRSGDLSLTAEQMAHDKEVLLRDYEKPHHQSASLEILKFHKTTDPSFSPPGPGICVDDQHKPQPIPFIAQEAPTPDCISPEGCLFCVKHRDIMSEDYCWKLASHLKIKILETNLYKPSSKQEVHPAYHVVDRLNQKLSAIAVGNKVREVWVKDSKDAVRAGRYHPNWDAFIQLMEVMI